MTESSDPRKKKRVKKPSTPDPEVQAEEVEAYELEEKAEEDKPRRTPKPGRSYLVDDAGKPRLSPEEERLLRAKKVLGMDQSENKPVKPIEITDPRKAAAKRDEARKKAGEIWAEQDRAQRRKFLITGLIIVALLTILFIYVSTNMDEFLAWLGIGPPQS